MAKKRWARIFVFIGLLMLITSSVYAQEPTHGNVSTEILQSSNNNELSTKASPSSEGGEKHGSSLGKELPLWSVLPFVGILLSIAIFPLALPEFWHHHYGKVAAAWALLFAIPFAIAYRGEAIYEMLHIYLIDYIPFIILLWGLFTISGGILIRGTLKGKPIVNTVMLFIGTVMASWVGTTGASMLMIRPVLRANADRRSKIHVVIFFIFLICNIGGVLTPLGDPPLFLGFLHGVPFFWTLNLIKPMALVSIALLLFFFALDSILYRREQAQHPDTSSIRNYEPLRIDGLFNLIFLAGIVGAVLMSGLVKLGQVSIFGIHIEVQNLLRDATIIIMGLLSLRFTPTSSALRQANGFTWFPIIEVGKLFAGIFMTILPALAILRAGSEGNLGFLIDAAQKPYHYFWMSGGLSSFLDNAPTYLTFLNTALGNFFAGKPELEAVHALINDQHIYLMAISCGAVFMGANTYIGNAPNFMVRSIAEENGIKMPSFFGYMAWSCGILIPLFILVTFVFFRG
jgi:Na+/H+ antiporter NhaD/arsenite permease-like protein